MSPADPPTVPEQAPKVGDLVRVRSRQWLVEEVVHPAEGGSPQVSLACADDDAQGQSLTVFWDFELDRSILKEEGWADLASRRFDSPRYFAAFFNTLRWNAAALTSFFLCRFASFSLFSHHFAASSLHTAQSGKRSGSPSMRSIHLPFCPPLSLAVG